MEDNNGDINYTPSYNFGADFENKTGSTSGLSQPTDAQLGIKYTVEFK